MLPAQLLTLKHLLRHLHVDAQSFCRRRPLSSASRAKSRRSENTVLTVNVVEMVLYCVLTDGQFPGDFTVLVPRKAKAQTSCSRLVIGTVLS
jgi:hypothetical protein